MLDSDSILRLYATVLNNDIVTNRISTANIRCGIQNMAMVYKPDISAFNSDFKQFSNFNDVAFRVAYLHKYAPLHTYIVLDVMLRILKNNLQLFQKFLNSGQFKFCCLGGGPGSDAIGVLAALNTVFSPFKSSATIIDSMDKWGATFASLIFQLKFGCFGTDWNNLRENFEWNYIGANLLLNMTNEVNKSIASASLITMVKFISAAACTETESMVEKIFRVMKPGALVLFIDNAAGGFTQVITRAAAKNNLKPVFGPQRHMEYSNEDLKVERFGYTSCFKTTVTAILLQKTFVPEKKRKNSNQNACVPGKKKPLLPSENINKTTPQKHVVPVSRFPNQNVSAFDTRKPLLPVQNVKETSPQRPASTQGKVNKILLPKNSSTTCGASSIRKQIRPPLRSSELLNNLHKSAENKNISRPTRSPQILSSNQHTSPVKGVNLNRGVQISHLLAPDYVSPASPELAAESSAFLPSEQNTVEGNRDDDSAGCCCSCCVIS